MFLCFEIITKLNNTSRTPEGRSATFRVARFNCFFFFFSIFLRGLNCCTISYNFSCLKNVEPSRGGYPFEASFLLSLIFLFLDFLFCFQIVFSLSFSSSFFSLFFFFFFFFVSFLCFLQAKNRKHEKKRKPKKKTGKNEKQRKQKKKKQEN